VKKIQIKKFIVKNAEPVHVLLLSLLAIALLSSIINLWAYKDSQHDFQIARQQLADAQQKLLQVSQPDTEALIAKVGQLILLPTNENPTIATVADLSKLQGQPFFAQAQVGDKVLIYTNAKKAILYRPSTNKIIEIAPINLGATPGQSGQPAAQPATGSY
jgi:hypothetical protein